MSSLLPAVPNRAPLRAVAGLFLRLGFTAFGGPAAHVAIMEDEVVRRRQWLTSERFLDLLGASNLIPGPSSTELAIFIGYEQAGALGLVLAGVCFIAPSALLVTALSWAYVRYGSLPNASAALYGVKPVVIAIVLQALLALAPKAVKRRPFLGLLGLAAFVASAVGGDALALLVAAGGISAAERLAARGGHASGLALATGAVGGGAIKVAAPVGLSFLFLTFAKAGALVFGSGYVLLAFLRADLVDRLHWLTEQQLLDAVAIGQVTPGPVFTTATFIGYLIAGPYGALLATFGIFLPGFILVFLCRPLIARIRTSAVASSFLDGVNVAAVGLMASVLVQLGRAALVDIPSCVIAVVSALLLLRVRINATWLVLGGATVGLGIALARG